jgi:hypothetical protein
MEWNNHPFEKDTPVRTFGSRSGLAAWDAENCDRCIKHDECELCDAIMAAYIGDGRVPLWVAKRIGCLYDPLYLSASLESTCRERCVLLANMWRARQY